MNDHRWSLEHLPWYLNGTLVGEEHAKVHRHVEACTVCQRELASLERISDSLNHAVLLNNNAPQALALLQDELRIDTSLYARLRARLTQLFSQTPPVMRYALAAQALLLAGIGSWLLMQSNPASPVTGYQTVSQGALAAGDVRLLFADDTSADQQRTLLRQFGLTPVAGPTERGILTLRWTNPGPHASVDELRAEAIVLFAEPLHDKSPASP